MSKMSSTAKVTSSLSLASKSYKATTRFSNGCRPGLEPTGGGAGDDGWAKGAGAEDDGEGDEGGVG